MYDLFAQPIVDEMNSPTPRLFMAVEIKYRSIPLRAHTGLGEFVIDGQNYIGVGQLGNIDAVPQSSDNSPSKLTMSLTGLDPTLVAETLNERSQGCPVKVMVCSYDDDMQITGASIIFAGSVSTQRFMYDKQMSIEVDVIDRMAEFERTGGKRFDNENYQARYPGDEFFIYLAQMSERTVGWGSKYDAPSFNYNG